MRRQLSSSIVGKHAAATTTASTAMGENGRNGRRDSRQQQQQQISSEAVTDSSVALPLTGQQSMSGGPSNSDQLRRLSRSPYLQTATRTTTTPHRPLRGSSTKTPPTSIFSSTSNGTVSTGRRVPVGAAASTGMQLRSHSTSNGKHSGNPNSSDATSAVTAGPFKKARATAQLLSDHVDSAPSYASSSEQNGTTSSHHTESSGATGVLLQNQDGGLSTTSSRAVQRLRSQITDASVAGAESIKTPYPSPPMNNRTNSSLTSLSTAAGGGERGLRGGAEQAPSSSNNTIPRRLSFNQTTANHGEGDDSSPRSGKCYSNTSRSRIGDDGVVDNILGFSNLGNTCFMNSTMQVMLRCPQLRNFLLNARLDIEYSRKTPLTSALQEVVRRMFVVVSESQRDGGTSLARKSSFSSNYSLSSTHGSIAPSHFKECLSSYKRAFAGFQQHDAQEFLRFALEGINEECNRIRRKPQYVELKDIEGEATTLTAARWMDNHRRNNDSVVQDEFCGQFLTRTQCHSCQHVSVSCEPFLDISLGLSKCGSSTIRLNDCLVDYFSSFELTNEEHGFRCEKCKQKASATRTTSLYQLPDILVLHLKRFKHHRLMPTKMNDLVNFPVEDDLSMQQYVAKESKEENAAYRLLGVVNHMGSAHSGHYTSFARVHSTQPDKAQGGVAGMMSARGGSGASGGGSPSWYEFNDSHVTPCRESAVVSSNAYVLFFERRRSNKL